MAQIETRDLVYFASHFTTESPPSCRCFIIRHDSLSSDSTDHTVNSLSSKDYLCSFNLFWKSYSSCFFIYLFFKIVSWKIGFLVILSDHNETGNCVFLYLSSIMLGTGSHITRQLNRQSESLNRLASTFKLFYLCNHLLFTCYAIIHMLYNCWLLIAIPHRMWRLAVAFLTSV